MIDASLNTHDGRMRFRYACETCGLLSGWQDSPEAAEADRPASCHAHRSRSPIPAAWEARKANA